MATTDGEPICAEPLCGMSATREGGKCEECQDARPSARTSNRDALQRL